MNSLLRDLIGLMLLGTAMTLGTLLFTMALQIFSLLVGGVWVLVDFVSRKLFSKSLL